MSESTARSSPNPFLLAGATIDPDINRVTLEGRTITVEPKIMAVLVLLAEHAGQLVSKEEFLEKVWAGTFVTDDVLTRAVAELRKIFSDDPVNPRLIETIRKRGYRLMPSAAVPARTESVAPRPARRRDRRLLALFPLLALAVAAVLWRARGSATAKPPPLRITPLTALPGNEVDAAISPDATRVAFAWNGGDGDSFQLYFRPLSGTALIKITGEGNNRHPAWSPEGTSLAYVHLEGGRSEVRRREIATGRDVVLLDGGRQIDDDTRLSWSPDGRRLALSVTALERTSRIELISDDGSLRTVLTHPPGGTPGDWSPAYSPDGASIAFIRAEAYSLEDLYVVGADGSNVRRVTFDSRGLEGVDWSPDGKSLIFSSRRAGLYSLWKVSASGGEPVWLAGGGTKMKHPVVSRRGNLIAYENWLYDVNLWVTGARDRALTSASDEWEFDPDLSPDGTRVAFVSTRSGEFELWSVAFSGGEPRRMTSLSGPRARQPRWSPDGSRLLFIEDAPGRSSVMTMSPEGGGLWRVVSEASGAGIASASWSHDGRAILFGSRRGGTWHLWKVRSQGGEPSPIGADGARTGFESADGGDIYFCRADRPGLYRFSVAAGSVEALVPEFDAGQFANWRVTREGIAYARPGPGGEPELLLLPFGAGSPRHLGELSSQAWDGFSMSSDGAEVVYGKTIHHSCDLKIIENAF